MPRPLDRLLSRLDLTRDELARILPIAAAYGLMLASLYLLKPARNALFLNRQGIAELPYVLVLVAVVGGITAAVYGRYAKTLRIDRLIFRTFLALGLMLLGFRWLLTTGWGWVVYAFYVWVALYGLLTTSLIWLLANAVFTSREARKVFGFIGTGGIAGAIVGGLFTGSAAKTIGTENLLFVCAGILLTSILLLQRVRPAELGPRRRRRARDKDKPEGLGVILQSNLLRNLAITAGLIAMVAVIVDIQFNEIVDRAYPDQDDKTAFFGQFFAYLSAFGFLFQLIATPYILRSWGVGMAIMILPVAMGLGSGAILLAPGLIAGILAKGADGGFRHSVHKAASEVLFLPVPHEVKSQAKLFLDTTVDTSFTGLGALLVLLLTGPLAFSHDKLSFISVPLVVAAVFVAARMRRAYVDAFRDALEGREINLEELRVNLDEAGVISALLPALDSDNERQILYVLDLLGSVRARSVKEPVQRLLTHASPEVRRRAMAVLRNQGELPANTRLEPLLLDPDAGVRLEAMLAACAADPRPAQEVLHRYLDADDPRLRAAALAAVAKKGPETAEALLSAARVKAFLAEEGEQKELIRAALARALAGTRDAELSSLFWGLAQDPSPRVARAAVEGLGANRSVDAAGWLIDRLADRALRKPARWALSTCGEPVVPELTTAFHAADQPLGIRLAIPRVLCDIPRQSAADALLGCLSADLPQLRRQAVRALGRLRSGYPELTFARGRVFAAVLAAAKAHFEGRQLLAVLRPDEATASPGQRLLYQAIEERQARALESIFVLLGLRYDPKDMANAYQGILSEKRAIRASALEFVDNVLHRELREVLIPILEPVPMFELRAQARELFGATIESSTDALVHLLEGDDPWLKACALFALEADEREQLSALVRQAKKDRNPVVREAAERAAA